ncbi:unnamed protein product [Trichobilharzia regenti]|nr:unnamed protein product [Trichobilharzia regenti]
MKFEYSNEDLILQSSNTLSKPNDNRFSQRRKPQPFNDTDDQIAPESFNFNKVSTGEILLDISEKQSTVSAS